MKWSPVFHSDVCIPAFLFPSPFPSDSPLQVRREHVSSLFYPPLTYCSSAHRVLVLSTYTFSPSFICSWLSSSSGTAKVQWAGFSPLQVEDFDHRSAGCKPWVQELSWRVFPLAGLLTGAPFLTLSNDVNTLHYTAFRWCSQLLRYPSSAIMLFIPVVSCGGHVGASFIIASNTKKSLLFFF